MKYKVLVLILLSFVLSGCSAVYKLEIKDDDFKENIELSMSNSESGNISYFTNNKFYAIIDGASDFVPYNKKINKESNATKINFSYNYNLNNYKKTTILKTCFSAYNIVTDGQYYILSTSKGIKCVKEEDTVLLENLTVIIKTNHEVVDNNSNTKSQDNNEFIWKFNKDNYDKAEIYMKLYRNKYVSDYNNINKIGIIIGVFIVIMIFLIAIYALIRFKKVQKI